MNIPTTKPLVAIALSLGMTGILWGQTTHTVTESADSIGGSLRDAIANAASGDTIDFDNSLSGATIRLTGGTIVIDKDLTIDASSLADRVQISGDTNNNGHDVADVRVFEIEFGSTVTLEFLTIRDGHTPSPPQGGIGPQINGAGIECFGDLNLINCLVTNNRTGDGAPGIDTAQTFNEDGADGGNGGGIYIAIGTCVIRNCTIVGNRTGDGGPSDFGTGGRGGFGGGIYCGTNSLVTIENSLIQGNTAGNGGMTTVDRGGSGGSGGGIYAGGGTSTVTNSTIHGNSAGSSAAGTTEAIASGTGGGIGASTTIHILNCSITGNDVPEAGNGGRMMGGGLAVSSGVNETSTLANTIIAGNTVPIRKGGIGPDFGSLNGTAPALQGVNFIGDNTDAQPWFAPGIPNADGHFAGSSFSPIDPLLGALQDNGGLTLTRLPLAGSLAIDPVGGNITTTFTFDQRGSDRLQNGIVDIGAVEVVYVAPPAIDNSDEIAILKSKIRALKKKLRIAKRNGQVAKEKRLAKKIRKMERRLQALM